jgi:hypothetical protein
MTKLVRHAAVVLACLAWAPAAHAQVDGAGVQRGPQGLKAFLLRVDEQARHEFPRTPSFAWTPVHGAKTYSFQLATSKNFNPSSMVWSSDALKVPATAVPIALPWITGQPYALYARVRANLGGKPTAWSTPYGFNMRWDQVPEPMNPSYPGLLRWTPIPGATDYEVWEFGAAFTFYTTTNVADERDLYTFHNDSAWTSTVQWRVRAVRRVPGSLPNSLPRTRKGPWSPIYTSFNPPFAVGDLEAKEAVSETVSDATHVQAHQLTPGFVFSGDQRAWGMPWYAGSFELFHVYVYTDEDCTNPVFTSAIVGSPAYAPRENATLKLPANLADLAKARAGVLPFGSEGTVLMTDGRQVTATEAGGNLDESDGSGTGSGSGSDSGGSSSTTRAPIDLWDTAWPNGGYYWTVVPVVMEPVPDSPGTFRYRDVQLPQDVCESRDTGAVLRFGKVSQPVVAASGAPYVSGLTPKGRITSAASKKPTFYGTPIVAWSPALGADSYEVQWSHVKYPWKAAGSVSTYSTSVSLPLTPGLWYYRIRGVDSSIPGSQQQMSWSEPLALRVAKPTFRVVG